ncbi:MAG: amylo-alpha-1,6-glucosidase [Syntrophales bacterium]
MMRARIEGVSHFSLKDALGLEWLETNGLGGYSSSTILNCHTRRYHGLLVANLKKPPGRHVLLSKFEDSLFIKGNEFFFSCHQYPGVFFPHNWNIMKEFQLVPYPTFIYRIDEMCIHKSVMLLHGENSVLIRYDMGNCPGGVLRLRPFLAYRGYHALCRQNISLHIKTHDVKNGFMIEPYEGMPSLYIQTNTKSKFFPSPVWYNNFEYSVEMERGFEGHEDLFQPGVLEIPVRKGSVIIIYCSTDMLRGQLKRIWTTEEARRTGEVSYNEAIVDDYEEKDKPHIRNLITAGRQFLIKTPLSARPAIVAGYHWFGEWGRDALISLPGLTFCCGRKEEGLDILTCFGEFAREGLLPNYSPDDEKEIAYNSVDASLWYFWAVQQLLKYTGDIEVVRHRMWPVMKSILRHFMNGTIFNVYMSDNGLLHAGSNDKCLTWMDAVVEGMPGISRCGYPVEVNALWYNAICFAAELAGRFDEHEFPFTDLIPKIQQSFRNTFWIEREGYLGDVFFSDFLDHAIRPNQILAVSLPFSPLTSSQQVLVVDKVKEHLLTPWGLRTLSPENRGYRGRYDGDSVSRDSAYHQGTVWPWLLGHFGEAYLKVAGDKVAAKAFLLNHIRYFLSQHIKTAGIGCISEIFDGDPPYRPNGCIAQAWSTAELLRLYSLITA